MNSGGLIEASKKWRTLMTNGKQVPPVNSGGLIEASKTSMSTRSWPSAPEFPPVNSGGLIEAGGAGVDGDALPQRFRR